MCGIGHMNKNSALVSINFLCRLSHTHTCWRETCKVIKIKSISFRKLECGVNYCKSDVKMGQYVTINTINLKTSNEQMNSESQISI